MGRQHSTDRLSAPDGGRGTLGETDVGEFTLVLEGRQGLDRILDGNGLVDTGGLETVDRLLAAQSGEGDVHTAAKARSATKCETQ